VMVYNKRVRSLRGRIKRVGGWGVGENKRGGGGVGGVGTGAF
jgi:hypothetical protein